MNVIAYISAALVDDGMRERARQRLARLITEGDLLSPKGPSAENVVRPSNFGACTLALWAERQGMLNIPRSAVDDHLTRLDLGGLLGAWEACLFAEGASAEGIAVDLEVVPEGGGHIDALAFESKSIEGTPPPGFEEVVPHVVEFKSHYDKRVLKGPKGDSLAHALQAGDYAERVGAPAFTVVYVAPANDKGRRMAQFTMQTAHVSRLVAEERERLAKALRDEPPEADPQASYACFTCRYGGCAKNRNKAANSVEALFA